MQGCDVYLYFSTKSLVSQVKLSEENQRNGLWFSSVIDLVSSEKCAVVSLILVGTVHIHL